MILAAVVSAAVAIVVYAICSAGAIAEAECCCCPYLCAVHEPRPSAKELQK